MLHNDENISIEYTHYLIMSYIFHSVVLMRKTNVFRIKIKAQSRVGVTR